MHPKRIANQDAQRPTVKDSDLDDLIQAAWDAGAWCQGNPKTNHVKVFPPNRSRMVPIPSTPSDHRTCQNKRSALRRGGIPV